MCFRSGRKGLRSMFRVAKASGRTTQKLLECLKQHVPKARRPRTTPTQEQGTHLSQPTRTQPNRKCKAKSKTQFEPTRERFSHWPTFVGILSMRTQLDSRFKVLTTACSQFHLSLLESVYISRKKLVLCRLKQFLFTHQMFRYDQSLLPLYGLHFSLSLIVQSV